MRYFITLKKHQHNYSATIRNSETQHETRLENLRLNPDDTISIKGNQISLGDIVQALIDYDDEWLEQWFDERGQLELGKHLYQQLFAEQKPDKNADCRIISEDEHICRLPWVLMAYRGVFLSMSGWSVALSHHDDCQDWELPPSPRILIVAPQPDEVAETDANNHIEALSSLLTSADSTYQPVIVETWDDFKTELKNNPHILYYYGHGEGDAYRTFLLFADNDNQRLDKPVADLLPLLRKHPPYIAYINCCYRDAGGSLGVGKQLSNIIPTVVTNRTVALIEAAQVQAMAFWKAVLLDDIAPHKAVSEVRGKMAELDFSVNDIRWLTPVLHCHYAKWTANPPKRFTDWQRDSHWRVKLDRVAQSSIVGQQTREMLRNRKPKALAYLWYGEENQGVDVFHQRLKIDLNQDLEQVIVHQILPEWQADLEENFHQCCHDMLCDAFEISSLEYLSAKIREISRSSTSQQTLIYIRHKPVKFRFKAPAEFHPKYIKRYLEWWNTVFVPKLPRQCYALLGLSYQVEEPAKFYDALIKLKLDELELSNTLFRLLDELEKVTKKDILDFLHGHNIPLPSNLKHSVISEILTKTKGDYGKILDAIQELETQAWQMRDEDNNEEIEW